MPAERIKTRYPCVYSRESATRRHNGRPDIYYEYHHRVDGRKVWIKVGWASEGVTAAYAAKVRGEAVLAARAGGPPQPQDITLDAAWIAYSQRHLRPGSPQLANDTALYRLHVAEKLGGLKLSRIGPGELDAMVRTMLDAGRSPQTAAHALGLVRRIWNRCARWRLTGVPCPVREAERPRVTNARLRFLSRPEAQALLDLLAANRTSRQPYAMALCSLHMGMRFGEVAVLTPNRIDFAHNAIRILDPKSGRDRIIPMTESVRRELESWIVRYGLEGDRLLFPARGSSDKMNRPSLTFVRAVESLGLNSGISDPRLKICFHTLRHTFASWLAQAGVPIYQIAESLGHSTLEMSRRYMHLAPESSSAVLAAIEGAMPRHASAPCDSKAKPRSR